ncbi:hypothetical protein MG293_017784 [Ovis ammon polii]|uniref:Uncharacterized protein n=1 Tax=Ovis ammon polii TaxID=230172 RepID=A0AAD4TUJ0_OVIAM|nr:hypothetical protein MG293_017784 [Ovis ammon polii]
MRGDCESLQPTDLELPTPRVWMGTEDLRIHQLLWVAEDAKGQAVERHNVGRCILSFLSEAELAQDLNRKPTTEKLSKNQQVVYVPHDEVKNSTHADDSLSFALSLAFLFVLIQNATSTS